MTTYKRPTVTEAEIQAVLSATYREKWNDGVQRKIDADIEKNRKADGLFRLPQDAAGRSVRVEQVSSDFIYGAHIFNYNQLGDPESNRRYRELYGELFNSATIAFYWKTLEPVEGHPRFETSYCDTEEFWNQCKDPKSQPHWRRPSTDMVVEFCRSKGIRLHGHTLVWGNNTWQYPDWLINKIPFDYLAKAKLERGVYGRLPGGYAGEPFRDMTAEEMADALPTFTDQLHSIFFRHVSEILLRYGTKISSWDVVNESATDFEHGVMVPGSRLCKSWYGPMPGDYTYRFFKIAESLLPASSKLNINDYNLSPAYNAQVKDLIERGCKVDIVGTQMHLFNPQECKDIADGKDSHLDPDRVWSLYERLGQTNRPIHLSEITITSPGEGLQGEIIQAAILRNMYRIWFSLKPMMGITWWNVVDDCGAPGEPSISGIFKRNMEPKLAYFAMKDLICKEWRTNLTVEADSDGQIGFRGFRGDYRLSWTTADGVEQSETVHLS